MSARDGLAAYIGYSPGERDDQFTAHLDAFRDEVVDDLIERCAVALSGCCSECDIAVRLIRRRGDVVKGLAS